MVVFILSKAERQICKYIYPQNTGLRFYPPCKINEPWRDKICLWAYVHNEDLDQTVHLLICIKAFPLCPLYSLASIDA